MILLRGLKRATRLVCACLNLQQLRFQCINDSCVQVVALIRRVYFYVSSQNEWSVVLEQRMNIKFYVEIGKDASDTRSLGEEAMKK
jgi:hypothetical protein